MTTLKELVANRLAELGLGPIEAAVQGGIERTFIRDIVEGKKKSIRANKIEELARALKLDPSALARNEAVPVNNENNNEEPRLKLVSSFDPDSPNDDGDGDWNGYSREHWHPHIAGALPEIDVKAGAGEGTVGEVINIPVGDQSVSAHVVLTEWLIPSEFLRSEAKASQNHTVVMEVIGDSMRPNFLHGDRVIVDLSQNQVLSDAVYVFSDGISPPQVKRFRRVYFTDPPEVEIVSDNPSYNSITVELSRVVVIGRVCGLITKT